MNRTWEIVSRSLGLHAHPEDLQFSQLALRAFIIFIVALALMRAGHKRSLARKSAFDTVFVVLIAAVLARAINGSAPFFPTIGVAVLLVLLHRILAAIASRSRGFELFIKGRSDSLVHDGNVLAEKMRAHDISQGDLDEDLYLRGHRSLEEIEIARLERSGDISFVKKAK